jgi:hypothetical protein
MAVLSSNPGNHVNPTYDFGHGHFKQRAWKVLCLRLGMEAKLVVADVLEAVYPNIADGKVSLALETRSQFPDYLTASLHA